MAYSRHPFARDALVATVILAALYGLGAASQAAPLQLPAYLVVVGFDVLEVGFGAAPVYRISFALYLVGLGVVAAAAAAGIRRLARGREVSSLRLGAAGALAVVGTLSLAVAASVFLGTTQREPVAIAGTAGAVMLALAGWLGGLFAVPDRRSR
ncbi:hypothetical protein [Saliphagus infecundisoli]|uniref:Uncharacterized protein n=1 Tax=Saliphagus infecundisoli TaxID=1849069 RepID=A0ABD5QJG1_9EURY|nr:hypothetical protein [Saliphagus infecundisoli]